jgi:hypothetical protein
VVRSHLQAIGTDCPVQIGGHAYGNVEDVSIVAE